MNFKEIRDYWKREIGPHYVTSPMYYLEIGYRCYANFEVTKDKADGELAFIYFKQAAHLGSDEALYYTALCYFEGTGVERNYKSSQKYLNQVRGFEKSVEDLQSKLDSKNEEKTLCVSKLGRRGFKGAACSADASSSSSEEVSTSISRAENSESSYLSSGLSSFDTVESASIETAVKVGKRLGVNFLRSDRRANCNSKVRSL